MNGFLFSCKEPIGCIIGTDGPAGYDGIAGGNPGDHALFLFAFTIFLLSLGGVRPTVTSIIIICTNIDIKHIHLNI